MEPKMPWSLDNEPEVWTLGPEKMASGIFENIFATEILLCLKFNWSLFLNGQLALYIIQQCCTQWLGLNRCEAWNNVDQGVGHHIMRYIYPTFDNQFDNPIATVAQKNVMHCFEQQLRRQHTSTFSGTLWNGEYGGRWYNCVSQHNIEYTHILSVYISVRYEI